MVFKGKSEDERRKNIVPVTPVPDNPKRKFMSKAEAIEDKKRLNARREAMEKAARDFDKGEEAPVEETQTQPAEVKKKGRKPKQ